MGIRKMCGGMGLERSEEVMREVKEIMREEKESLEREVRKSLEK